MPGAIAPPDFDKYLTRRSRLCLTLLLTPLDLPTALRTTIVTTTTTTEVDSTNDDGHLASSLLEIPPPSFIDVVAANMIV